MTLSVIKHLRYFLLRAKIELMQFWEYRAEMLSSSFGTYGYTLMAIFFIHIIFQQASSIGGWSQPEILMLLGVGQSLFYVYAGLFWSTYSWVSESIQNGQLDSFLLKPINALFSLSTYRFNLVQDLPSYIIPVVIIRYAWQVLNISLTGQLVWVLISWVLSAVIFLCIFLSISLLAFWWTDTRELSSFYDRISEMQNYPLAIYPKNLKFIFLTVIPIGIIAYVPTTFLLHGFQLDLFLYQLIALGFFVTLTKFLWIKGLQNYSSASS